MPVMSSASSVLHPVVIVPKHPKPFSSYEVRSSELDIVYSLDLHSHRDASYFNHGLINGILQKCNLLQSFIGQELKMYEALLLLTTVFPWKMELTYQETF